ncbi:MAG: YceI family protein [Actinobacteria bacterium]|nr:YceI family protein [Actinomycetota bacterium]
MDRAVSGNHTVGMSLKRLGIRLAIAVLALATLAVGGAWVYATFINDAAEEFEVADLDERLDASAEQPSEEPQDSAPDATTQDESAQADTTEADATQTDEDAQSEDVTEVDDGTQLWITTEGSEVGYRVSEVLFGIDTEGVGRTEDVTGSVTLIDTTMTEAEFTVDVASMKSDDGRRDGQFRGRIMETQTFPTASFTLTSPIDLGVTATEGATLDTTISGELTMHGVTNPVSFEIAAKIEGNRLGVIGTIPVTFVDYDIVDPSITGITVKPEGVIEFVLVFSRQ